MPQSLDQILLHLVFSTKHREPWLLDSIRDELHAYLGGVVKHHGGHALAIGSVEDHIHLLIAHPRTMSPADLLREIKTSSSRWIKGKDGPFGGFAWQSGYGVFSVSPSHRDVVTDYIANQSQHHRKVTFQDEYRRPLEKNGVAWDERFVWD